MFWGELIGERWTTANGFHPEGMSAISRGLSEATPSEELRAVRTDSFNRVGNAPRVVRRNTITRRRTRGALPTRLNESVLTARSSSEGVASLNPRLMADIPSG